MDLHQTISKDPKALFEQLPQGIMKLLKYYGFEHRVTLNDEDKLRQILEEKQNYLNKNLTSIFSLWKILFRQFADLQAADRELFEEVFKELKIISLGDLKNLLYVGENFNEKLISEFLFILLQIKNFDEIHIINYDGGSIRLENCLENVRDDLFYMEPDTLEMMMNKVIIKEDAQLHFDYLNAYIEQNTDKRFIIIIGMEKLIRFRDNSAISSQVLEIGFNLNIGENADWDLLLSELDRMYKLTAEKNVFLLTVYRTENLMENAAQNIQLHYSDTMRFDVLFDQTKPGFYEGEESGKEYAELLELIYSSHDAYEKIFEYKGKMPEDNFIALKAYFFLARNDFFHAIAELEQLPEDADREYKFLLAELYAATGENQKAFEKLKSIYEEDKYFHNVVNAIIHSLREQKDLEERFLWIKRGLALNPDDPVMVSHLANYYTMKGDYLESANQWKKLYVLTGDPFNELLAEINWILCAADKKELKHICAWADEKPKMFPQYADEINNRIGNIIFDEISKDMALPYFEKVTESFDESYCVAAVKKMEIYYRNCSRKRDREVKLSEVEFFVKKLLEHVVILTYDSQSVYSWSGYIQRLFSDKKWTGRMQG